MNGNETSRPRLREDIAAQRTNVTTLGDLLLSGADRMPDKAAVVFPHATWTYRELADGAMTFARSLTSLGLQPGDHVGLLLPNGRDLIEATFGVALAGGVSVLLNSRYQPGELAFVTENADLTTIITNDAISDHVDFVQRLHEAFPKLADAEDAAQLSLDGAPRLQRIVLMGHSEAKGMLGEAEFRAAGEGCDEAEVHARRVRVRLRDLCLVLYTSGTSSNPKGCLLTHEALVRNATNIGRNRWRYDHDDRVFSPMPLFHIAALSALLASIDAGATFYGTVHFDPGVSLEIIEKERITAIFLPFVTFLQAMSEHPDFDRRDLTSVRVMNSCFAMQPEQVGQAFARAMPDTLQVGTFGMTETCGIVSTGGYDMDPALGFEKLGYPLTGLEVRVIDAETGEDMAPGGQGEVLVRGYSVFSGYYRDEAKTAEVLDAEGWYHSGDIGSIDENGHVMFHGRLKDMLKVGGENVASAEVEAVLSRHPAVRLAQVVGIPDPRLAEVPAAFVELLEGQHADEAELIEFCRGQIASFKLPRLVRFTRDWPMSSTKIRKGELRDRLLEELAGKGG